MRWSNVLKSLGIEIWKDRKGNVWWRCNKRNSEIWSKKEEKCDI